MKTAVLDKMMESVGKGERLPYQKQIAVSKFLGQPLNSNLQPLNVMSNQQRINASTAAAGAKEGAQNALVGKTTQKGLAALSISDRYQTSMQGVSGRER
jgi:hypothetical protein